MLGVEDRIDARFELYTVHVVLLLERLKGQGEEAGDVGQALFDTYLSALDHALRELGVGDLSVAKKMRRLGETIYARTHALTAALQPQAAPFALEAALAEPLFRTPATLVPSAWPPIFATPATGWRPSRCGRC